MNISIREAAELALAKERKMQETLRQKLTESARASTNERALAVFGYTPDEIDAPNGDTNEHAVRYDTVWFRRVADTEHFAFAVRTPSETWRMMDYNPHLHITRLSDVARLWDDYITFAHADVPS